MKKLIITSLILCIFSLSCSSNEDECNCESVLEENISELSLHCNGFSNNYPNYNVMDRTPASTSDCSSSGQITIIQQVNNCGKIGTKRRRIECN